MTKRDSNCGIYTLNGYNNYGNRLQLFALAKVLKKLGHETKVYWPKTMKDSLKYFLKQKTPLVARYPKEKKLRRFSKSYIPKITKKCQDVAIIGSDQVWNPKYLLTRPYLLNVPGDGVKISYAASIGKEEFTNEQKEMFSKALKNYAAISVREQSAKKLLQPLLPEKKIEVVLDPTLLLDKKEYEALEKKPKNLESGERYILCYILGNRDHQKAIEKFARDNNYKVIIFSDKRDSNYGIEEFLYLVHHAQLICTDSFHACVFSFVFDKPFVAFKRTGESNYMYTRLQNLFDTFKLTNREFNGEEISRENLIVDYSEAKDILKKEREKSINFLKNALENKK